ncbi:MAG: helix-turn-helix transcriptional regulator [Deltaproteobacteria bacterium]|nr:helix-turn-helix transcriptional regulator [Deltaproteobacteria bacterium]
MNKSPKTPCVTSMGSESSKPDTIDPRLASTNVSLIEEATSFFKALAHPIRLQILLLLSEFGPLSAGTLQGHCAMEQSTFSHQLRVLREHRLVSAERIGREMHYALVDDHVQHIVKDAIEHLVEETPLPRNNGRRFIATKKARRTRRSEKEEALGRSIAAIYSPSVDLNPVLFPR